MSRASVHWFRETRQVFDYLNEHGFGLDTLSMGTSADFEAAIAEGSTMVRIGTAIFGPRETTGETSIITHMNITAAFIGGGNMGGALIRGLIARGLAPQHIGVGEAVQARRIALADELGVHVTADNREAVHGADVVVLAVKPQDMAGTVQPLRRSACRAKPLVISIAAGIRVADIAGLVRTRACRWCAPCPIDPRSTAPARRRSTRRRVCSAAQRTLAEQVLGAVGTTVVGRRPRTRSTW